MRSIVDLCHGRFILVQLKVRFGVCLSTLDVENNPFYMKESTGDTDPAIKPK